MSDAEQSRGGEVEEEESEVAIASQMFRLAKELGKHMATGICATIDRLGERSCYVNCFESVAVSGASLNCRGARREREHLISLSLRNVIVY